MTKRMKTVKTISKTEKKAGNGKLHQSNRRKGKKN